MLSSHPSREIEINETGFCMCGCGGLAPIATKTSTRCKRVAGKPQRYIAGHYRMTPEQRERSIRSRFTKYCSAPNDKGCMLWTGTKDQCGYGRLQITYSNPPAHRISWELHRGPIPEGLQVLHKCDVRACVNPDHLFLGTQLDNIEDMKQKGRARGPKRSGELNSASKLTALQVQAIRREYSDKSANQYELAHKYGVSQSNISYIVRGVRWNSNA